MQIRDKIYINGAWVPSTGTRALQVINSTTEEVMGRVPEGTPEDVNRAVKAAVRAFPAWSERPVEERVKYCQAIAKGLKARQEEIAALIAQEVGMPLKLAGVIQVGLPVTSFASMAEMIKKVAFEEQLGNSLIVREPIGVAGCITPWNYPRIRSRRRWRLPWPQVAPLS